jgi:hypothetical protein
LLLHADMPQDGKLKGGLRPAHSTLRTNLRQVDGCLADLLQMEAVAWALVDGDPCLSTSSSRRRELELARRAAAAGALAVTAYAFLSTNPSWRRGGKSPRKDAAARAQLIADYVFLSTASSISLAPRPPPSSPSPPPSPPFSLFLISSYPLEAKSTNDNDTCTQLDANDAFLSTAASQRREVHLAWADARSPPALSVFLFLSLRG